MSHLMSIYNQLLTIFLTRDNEKADCMVTSHSHSTLSLLYSHYIVNLKREGVERITSES
jgi:hypothetical protein